MISSARVDQYQQLKMGLDNYHPTEWDDLIDFLEKIRKKKRDSLIPCGKDALKFFARGTAFITFSYGIDGVTIEISKYADTLHTLFEPFGNPSIHFIGGYFQPQVASILNPDWHQFQIDGIDGWSKWDGGKWFEALFKKKMKPFSTESKQLTEEIFNQAVVIAKSLGKYFIDNQISLAIPVNIASNPGNIALTLGLVLATEILGTYVLNSNHDFFWESGKSLAEREPREKPGLRDHFFRNVQNKAFFSFFTMLYPWNGNRWLQANINARQSRRLTKRFGFPKEKVFDISTCIADTFFEPYSNKDVIDIRLRMGHILSDGNAIMRPIPIDDHLSMIDQWMKRQQPVILGARSNLSVDPKSKDLLILLQPTRIVSRKRIERNLDLIGALFEKSTLREEFENNPNRQLILHITGPTPREHQDDLEKVIFAYKNTIQSLPEKLADQIFLAFSAGRESHSSFANKNFEPLTIETLYRMANVVMFPSETEGRGLPIIESSASGIPIICSQYHPREVFDEVIGRGLPTELRIQYTRFPEGKFRRAFLSDVVRLLIHPETQKKQILHNKNVVHTRYSHASLKNKFKIILDQLCKLQ